MVQNIGLHIGEGLIRLPGCKSFLELHLLALQVGRGLNNRRTSIDEVVRKAKSKAGDDRLYFVCDIRKPGKGVKTNAYKNLTGPLTRQCSSGQTSMLVLLRRFWYHPHDWLEHLRLGGVMAI